MRSSSFARQGGHGIVHLRPQDIADKRENSLSYSDTTDTAAILTARHEQYTEQYTSNSSARASFRMSKRVEEEPTQQLHG